MTSKFLALSRNDLIKGVIMAVLGATAQIIISLLQASGDPFTETFWLTVLKTSVSAGGLYLLKNFLTTQDGKFLGTIG